MNNKFLIIHTAVLPDIFEKVIEVKEMLKTNQATEITEAVKVAGISRSTFYKYKDFVFTLAEGVHSHKVIISFLLSHKPGTLSAILDKLALHKGNVLTINQDIPIHNTASVTITFDILNLDLELSELIEEMRQMDNVIKVDLIAME